MKKLIILFSLSLLCKTACKAQPIIWYAHHDAIYISGKDSNEKILYRMPVKNLDTRYVFSYKNCSEAFNATELRRLFYELKESSTDTMHDAYIVEQFTVKSIKNKKGKVYIFTPDSYILYYNAQHKKLSDYQCKFTEGELHLFIACISHELQIN